jgi:hypothetical protein
MLVAVAAERAVTGYVPTLCGERGTVAGRSLGGHGASHAGRGQYYCRHDDDRHRTQQRRY